MSSAARSDGLRPLIVLYHAAMWALILVLFTTLMVMFGIAVFAYIVFWPGELLAQGHSPGLGGWHPQTPLLQLFLLSWFCWTAILLPIAVMRKSGNIPGS